MKKSDIIKHVHSAPQQHQRVFARQIGRELNKEELNKISGGKFKFKFKCHLSSNADFTGIDCGV